MVREGAGRKERERERQVQKLIEHDAAYSKTSVAEGRVQVQGRIPCYWQNAPPQHGNTSAHDDCFSYPVSSAGRKENTN